MIPHTIGMLIFDDVEELDFTGPWEVFGQASRQGAELECRLIGPTRDPVRARYGLTVIPDTAIADCGPLDAIVVPGGLGARVFARSDQAILELVRRTSQHGWVISVCTGALVLAAAGVLQGHRATTHHSALEWLRSTNGIDVVDDQRWIIEDSVATSAGVSAGIDLALELVRRWYGDAIAQAVIRQMEWPHA